MLGTEVQTSVKEHPLNGQVIPPGPKTYLLLNSTDYLSAYQNKGNQQKAIPDSQATLEFPGS